MKQSGGCWIYLLKTETMNDRFKFRGRHHLAGNWCYGFLFKADDDWIITPDGYRRYKVDPKTIGQYTGLKDKNGKLIYEGDVVREYRRLKHKLTNEEMEHEEIRLVQWGHHEGDYESSDFFGWITITPKYPGCLPVPLYDEVNEPYTNPYWIALEEKYEIIGNIYENPELTKAPGKAVTKE